LIPKYANPKVANNSIPKANLICELSPVWGTSIFLFSKLNVTVLSDSSVSSSSMNTPLPLISTLTTLSDSS